MDTIFIVCARGAMVDVNEKPFGLAHGLLLPQMERQWNLEYLNTILGWQLFGIAVLWLCTGDGQRLLV